MLKLPKLIKRDELIKGSISLLILINLFNILNFLFHFVLGRMLGKEQYGILAVVMSFVFIYSIPSEAIQTVISRYSSLFSIKNENGKIKSMLAYSMKKLFVVAIFVFVLFTVVYIPLSRILRINFYLLLISNIMIFSFFLFPVVRGILQGTKRFNALGFNMILESVLKLAIAVLLVLFGLGVFGAISGVVIAFLILFGASFFFIPKILSAKSEKIDGKKLLLEGRPIMLIMLAIVFFYSIDIIIARAVFSAAEAGEYAVLSMIGKMIFFGTFAISKAMYPISTQRFDKKEGSRDLFKKSLILILIIDLIAILAVLFFSNAIVFITYGADYLGVAKYLIYTAVAFSILSVTNILLLYGLSRNKITMKRGYSLFTFIAFELIFLPLLGKSILEFAFVFIIINLVMLLWSAYIVYQRR